MEGAKEGGRKERERGGVHGDRGLIQTHVCKFSRVGTKLGHTIPQ